VGVAIKIIPHPELLEAILTKHRTPGVSDLICSQILKNQKHVIITNNY
jgi:hypothetical protein